MPKIPIIDEKDLNALIEQALNGNGVLATPQEVSQMITNIQGVSINSKPRKDGRYQGYIVEDDQKKYVYGTTKEEVAMKIKTFLRYGLPKKKVPKKKPTPLLSDWLKNWLELYKKPNVKPKTFEGLWYAVKPLIRAFGETPIADLKTDDLQAFFLSMTTSRTRESSVGALNQALEKARKQGIIKNNPCDGLELKAHKRQHRMALTIEEQRILLDEVANKPIKRLFSLLLTTGLRVGEALALTSQDLDFQAKTVNVNKNVVFIKNKRVLQDTPKTDAGVRTVPIPENVLDMFKDDKGVLFNITYNSVRLAFKRLKQKTGIDVSAHILRHTYATRLEEAGISPKVKQYLLGHSSLEMTQNIYTDIQKSYLDTLNEKITSVFN